MADEKNLKDTAADAVEKIQEASEEAKAAAQDVANEAKETAESVIDDVKEAVQDAVSDAKEAVQDVIDGVTDKTEDIADTVEEVADGDAAAEVPEQQSEIDRAVAEALAERDAQDAAKLASRNKRLRIAGIIAGAVIVVGGIVLSGFVSKTDDGIDINTYGGWLPKLVNKYNHMGYVDVTGNTVGSIAKNSGMSVADFKDQFGLPEDMPASTIEMAALYMLPAKNYGSMYGVDFATMKELMKIPDTTEDGEEITEDTPWGVVQGEITIADYIGDTGDGEAFKNFKEEFGFGDEITADTKWKEVRTVVDEKTRQDEIDSKKEAEEAAKQAEEESDQGDTADTAADDADANADTADDTSTDAGAADDTSTDAGAADGDTDAAPAE